MRRRLLTRGLRVAMPLPDVVLALLLGAYAAQDFLSESLLAVLPGFAFPSHEDLGMVLFVEGGFLMGQATLVDIATRLRKRPPVWAIPLIVAVVFFLSSGAQGVFNAAMAGGAVVLIPLLLSLAERGTMLWHMPVASPLERMAARALISNRIIAVVFLGGLLTALLVTGAFVTDVESALRSGWPIWAAGAIYFAVAAFDEWRVGGPRFAARPRVLFGIDALGISNTDRVL